MLDEQTQVRIDQLLEGVDASRARASGQLDSARRSELGQFFTPSPIARFMASMFEARPREVRLLEAGAGVGSLLAAFVAASCRWDKRPRSIAAVAYEVDGTLAEALGETLRTCEALGRGAGVPFTGEVRREDFIAAAARALGDRCGRSAERYNCTILNPPYRKINSASEARRQLRSVGIETGNLYTAFLALAVKLLAPGGELVAITPRSFCNGPYFRSFRELLLDAMDIRRVHIFEARDRAFGDDDVLQENIIVHARKRASRSSVVISSSRGIEPPVRERTIDHAELVYPGDAERFIHIVQDDRGREVAEQMRACSSTLRDLGLEVSTGRVVDFRAKPFLRKEATAGSAPLIYPGHFVDSFVEWPRANYRKPNALAVAPETLDLMLPRGTYVLVKRFTTKEERRRVVAAIYDPGRVDAERVGFENHLNVFHVENKGLPEAVARGLAVYLSSTVVDQFFRQFNGHTQVNATDLRNMKYPTRDELLALGARVGSRFPGQGDVDAAVAEVVGLKAPRAAKAPSLAPRSPCAPLTSPELPATAR